jgi:hypothetical protein
MRLSSALAVALPMAARAALSSAGGRTMSCVSTIDQSVVPRTSFRDVRRAAARFGRGPDRRGRRRAETAQKQVADTYEAFSAAEKRYRTSADQES